MHSTHHDYFPRNSYNMPILWILNLPTVNPKLSLCVHLYPSWVLVGSRIKKFRDFVPQNWGRRTGKEALRPECFVVSTSVGFTILF